MTEDEFLEALEDAVRDGGFVPMQHPTQPQYVWTQRNGLRYCPIETIRAARGLGASPCNALAYATGQADLGLTADQAAKVIRCADGFESSLELDRGASYACFKRAMRDAIQRGLRPKAAPSDDEIIAPAPQGEE